MPDQALSWSRIGSCRMRRPVAAKIALAMLSLKGSSLAYALQQRLMAMSGPADGERALVRARGYTLRGENLSYDLAQGAATAPTAASSPRTGRWSVRRSDTL